MSENGPAGSSPIASDRPEPKSGRPSDEDAKRARRLTIPLRSSGSPAPLSFAQSRMWFFAQLEPESAAYHSLRATRWIGPLEIGVLERSLAQVVLRHEVLRTRFPVVGGTAEQEVAPPGVFRLPVVDLTAFAAEEREERAREWVGVEFRRPFDLVRGSPLRATLLRLSADEHLLVLMAHHIVIDGWSMGILYRELAALYAAFSAGKPSPLPELPIQYVDYATWQRERLQGETLQRELAYWRGRLAGAPAVLDLPFDRPRPAKQTYKGGQVFRTLPADLIDALRALSRRERATLFMIMLAAFKALFWRYTGQTDLVVGTPSAGRNRKELEDLIGCFANTLILRTDCSGDPSFRELLGRVRETALGAYAHQEVPFERVVEELHPERRLQYHPLFQVMFNFRDFPVGAPEVAGLRLQDVDIERDASLVDLSLSLGRGAEGFHCRIFYNSDLFDAATVERLAGHYQVLLAGIAADPEQRLSRLPLLPDAERHQLLIGWNATSVSYPAARPIHQLIEEQVTRTPEATAVAVEGARLTYHELNASANRVALGLTARGIGRGSYVPILMDRGLELVISMLAVIKTGAAFVPLDPAWPIDRIRQALAELNGGFVLVNPASPFVEEVIGRPLVEVHLGPATDPRPNLEIETGPEDPIYAIYTSGSTGTPKAAVVPHRGITNRFLWMNDFFGRESASAVLQTTRHVYDSAVWQLFWPLINGGKTVIPGPELELSAAYVSGLIARHGVTMTDFVPSAFHALVPQLVTDQGIHPKLRSLRSIIVGGEEITPATTRSFMTHFPGVRVVNLYGPTEASIGCICYEVTGFEGGRIPIGRPISNVQVLVLDRSGQSVPVGVTGELYLSGACLGLGYLGDELKTRAAFVPNLCPEIPSPTLYRTGDLVRYLPDGNLEFLGRADRQIKLRGHRIELGEVEAVLTQHPGVREAVVVVREDIPGDRCMVGYILSDAGATPPGAPELRTHLRQRLPDYMVPSAFVPIDALPLTAGGKLDSCALPAPDPTRPELEEAFVAPRTPLEQGLATVWSAVLGIQRIGIQDNFFDLGGHSLLATQVMSRIRQAFRVDLPLRTIFEGPTVAALAARVASAQNSEASVQAPDLVPVAREAYRATSDQRRHQ
jgi:amino acid adenylation domain-containing protein